MKRLLFFSHLILILDASFSCQKTANAVIVVNKDSVFLGNFDGYANTFIVKSSVAWKTTILPTNATQWVHLNTSQGQAGITLISVSSLETTLGPTEQATIVITPQGSTTPAVAVTLIQSIYAMNWNNIFGRIYGALADAPQTNAAVIIGS